MEVQTMKSPGEFLDQLRARLDLPSDYAVARLLGVTPQHVSRWRSGRGGFSDEQAARVAELLGIEAGYVLARLYEERSTSEAARVAWRDLAEKLAPAAACLALLLLAPYLFDSAGIFEHAQAFSGGSLYIMSNALVLMLALGAAIGVLRSGVHRA
jgi:transcriptional regulator with XRE-family HTH domain